MPAESNPFSEQFTCGRTRSSKRNPCPVCGRTGDSDCEIRPEGLVFCHRGSRWHPPKWATRTGDHGPGADGQDWAFLGDSQEGRAMFRTHQPMDAKPSAGNVVRLAPRRSPAPAPITGPVILAPITPIPPQGSPWAYSATQRVLRIDTADGKTIRPQTLANGQWINNSGSDAWPLFGRIALGWVLELEGEKCCELALSAGVAAITQPGHNHTAKAITARYQALVADGVVGVVYLADHDDAGRRKAETCGRCAAEAGLPFVVLYAGEVWPDLPVGGSIDDAPGSAADRVAAIAARLAEPRPTPDLPAHRLLVAAAGEPERKRANAGAWAAALTAGLGDRLRKNLMSQRLELDGREIGSDVEELLFVYAQQARWQLSKAACMDGTRAAALENAYHPVREYLDQIAADPAIQPLNLDTIAARYLGVTDPLSAAMVRCLLIGAVARIHQPGCEAPAVVVLRGAQGIGKSRFWQALAGAFYVASRTEDGAKDQALAMHRSWLYDLDELDKITTARQAAGLRSLITTPADTFRAPYARREETFPRQFVIVGAVNGDGFLTDPEGNRRYWVIDCPQAKDSSQFIDGPGAARDRDAIWKAAVLAYRAGVAWQLTTGEQAASNIRNGKWEAVDEWQDAISGWAESTTTPGGFTTREAIAGAGLRNAEAITKSDEMRAGEALKRAGFERQTQPVRRPDGQRARHWVMAQPGTTSSPEVVSPETPSSTGSLTLMAQPTQAVKGHTDKEVMGGDARNTKVS